MANLRDNTDENARNILAATVIYEEKNFESQMIWLTYRRALIALPTQFPVGTELSVKAELLPQTVFDVTGLVHQASPSPMSDNEFNTEIWFTKISPYSLAQLQTYLDELLERSQPEEAIKIQVNLNNYNKPGRRNLGYALSSSSIFVANEIPYPVGTRIDLRLFIGPNEIVVNGIVASRMPLTKAIHIDASPGINIKFISFEGDGKLAFYKFLKERDLAVSPLEDIYED